MTRWRGTGRYDTTGWKSYNGIGNPASRSSIVENLIRQGLISRDAEKALSISADGIRLLDGLHPDCEDQDQVLRLYSWSELSLEDAKEKVARYIRTFFGKQKRFLSKRGRA